MAKDMVQEMPLSLPDLVLPLEMVGLTNKDRLVTNIESSQHLPITMSCFHPIISQGGCSGAETPDDRVQILHPLTVLGMRLLDG